MVGATPCRGAVYEVVRQLVKCVIQLRKHPGPQSAGLGHLGALAWALGTTPEELIPTALIADSHVIPPGP